MNVSELKTWETRTTTASGYTFTYQHAMIPITINGETRDVECKRWFSNDEQKFRDRFETVNDAALFSKGRGGKLWPHRVKVWVRDDGTLKVDLSATILNRHAYRAVAWIDFQTSHLSQHNSAHYGPPAEPMRDTEAWSIAAHEKD